MVLLFKQIFGKDFIHTAKFATKNTDIEEEPKSQQNIKQELYFWLLKVSVFFLVTKAT